MEFRVVRRTDRFDETQTFYTEAIGWPVLRDWTDGGRGCLIAAGSDACVELLEVSADVVGPVGGLFISAQVPSVTAAHQRLLAAAAPVTQEPTDQPWGHRNLATVDPSGVAVVLFEVLA